jgi:hypothetical protein
MITGNDPTHPHQHGVVRWLLESSDATIGMRFSESTVEITIEDDDGSQKETIGNTEELVTSWLQDRDRELTFAAICQGLADE